MANEIWTTYDEGNVIYALIWNTDDQVWNQNTLAFETYTDVNIVPYAVRTFAVEDSNLYSGDFPISIDVGIYKVQLILKVAPPATDPVNDIPIAQGEIVWSGTFEITSLTLSAQGSRVLNKYPTRNQPDV